MNLFLFAHQDDEYGVYPLLERLASGDEAITVIYLTSGTPDGQESTRRNRESREVLCRLGVSGSDIYFLGADLGLPDGKLFRHVERAAQAVQAYMETREKPTRIFTPAWEGGHQDHDATYIVACYLAKVFSCVDTSRQFPLYHGRGLPGSLWHTFSPLPENGPVEAERMTWRQRLHYVRYCLLYHSQWRTWLGLYPMYVLNLLISGRQLLQPLRLARLNETPHSGPRLYERRGFCGGDEFGYHTKALVDKIIG